ncbi:ABC transporter ATP-binding protein [Microbacterium sp. AGC85]
MTTTYTEASRRSEEEAPLLSVEDLVVEFPTKGGTLRAISGVSFDVQRGETLSIVGESGSGKSTTANAVMQLVEAQHGRVVFDGKNLDSLNKTELRRTRPRLQMIFQDPIASLNPRRSVEDIVGEGLGIWPDRVVSSRDEDVDALLREVGMRPDVVRGRKAGEFSGGQCQRLAIARVLAIHPELVVCDEPVSALDVSVQAQILNLLRRMKDQHGLTLLFISHDLSVVRNISDRVLVLYLGRVCEIASTDLLFESPAHPYTQLLLDSVPRMHEGAQSEELATQPIRDLPSPLDPPSGCRFRTRCPLAKERCATEVPELRDVEGRQVACHFAEESLAMRGSAARVDSSVSSSTPSSDVVVTEQV